MAPSSSSDLVLQVATLVGVLSISVAILLVVQVLVLSRLNARRTARRAALHARWRPLLARAALGEDPGAGTPVLLPRETADLLLLWNGMQDGVRGSAHDGLNAVAERLGLHAVAARWVTDGSLGQRVVGLATLGHLQRAGDWDRVRPALDDAVLLVSLGAARTLLQLDPGRAAPLVLDAFLTRSDWPAPRLGTLLREAGADAVAQPLRERLLGGDASVQRRLLPLLPFAESPHDASVVQSVVATSDDPQVLSIALRQLHGREALPRVRVLATHDDALVRSAAAHALGRIALPDDLQLLLALMSDRDWWVRYRAAQAVLQLRGVDGEALAALRDALPDRFARDALDQACAERALRRGAVVAPEAPAAVPSEAPAAVPSNAPAALVPTPSR